MSTVFLHSSYIPKAISTEGHLLLMIPGSDWDEYALVPLCTDSQERCPDFLADQLPFVITREGVRRLARKFCIPFEVHLLVPWKADGPLILLVGYCTVYVVQLKVGLCFPLLPILVKCLQFYNPSLFQVVPNAVMIVVPFERHCQDLWVTSSVALFRDYFIVKIFTVAGWYYFSPRKKGFKVDIFERMQSGRTNFYSSTLPRGSSYRTWEN